MPLLFVCDLNDQQEWFGSTTTNRHGVAAIDFATVSGGDQLVVGSTHARGGTLDLLMTDVPDLVPAVPNLCVSSKVFLEHQVNLNKDHGAIQHLPCVTLGQLTIQLRFRTSDCRCWLEVMYQLRLSVCATRISLGLMINASVL